MEEGNKTSVQYSLKTVLHHVMCTALYSNVLYSTAAGQLVPTDNIISRLNIAGQGAGQCRQCCGKADLKMAA